MADKIVTAVILLLAWIGVIFVAWGAHMLLDARW